MALEMVHSARVYSYRAHFDEYCTLKVGVVPRYATDASWHSNRD